MRITQKDMQGFRHLRYRETPRSWCAFYGYPHPHPFQYLSSGTSDCPICRFAREAQLGSLPIGIFLAAKAEPWKTVHGGGDRFSDLVLVGLDCHGGFMDPWFDHLVAIVERREDLLACKTLAEVEAILDPIEAFFLLSQ